MTTLHEEQYWSKDLLVLGVDEVATGNLFGPMIISGVIFPSFFDFTLIPGLKDSKQVKDTKRFELEFLIKEKALWWFCKSISADIVDRDTAHHAKLMGAAEAINNKCKYKNTIVIMDGNFRINNLEKSFKSECLVKGDMLCKSISAASIIAKCEQRRFILSVAEKYKEYDVGKNNGYWSPTHIAAIEKYGATEYHRKTYLKNIKY